MGILTGFFDTTKKRDLLIKTFINDIEASPSQYWAGNTIKEAAPLFDYFARHNGDKKVSEVLLQAVDIVRQNCGVTAAVITAIDLVKKLNDLPEKNPERNELLKTKTNLCKGFEKDLKIDLLENGKKFTQVGLGAEPYYYFPVEILEVAKAGPDFCRATVNAFSSVCEDHPDDISFNNKLIALNFVSQHGTSREKYNAANIVEELLPDAQYVKDAETIMQIVLNSKNHQVTTTMLKKIQM